MSVYIYGLICPLTDRVRYIGKSVNPEQRLRAHISAARREACDHHTARWIRKLLSGGHRPKLRVLRTVLEGESWQEVERSVIADARKRGEPLTNTTSGGEGLDYSDPEADAAYRANLSAAMKAFSETPEGRALMARVLERANAPDVVARRSAAIRAHYKCPKVRARHRQINSEINGRPEVKAKKSRASKRMWECPERRSRFLEVFASEETKRKQSERRKAAWADPEVGARLRAIHGSEETRRRKSEAARRRNTPEYRALLSERLKAAWARRREKERSA